MSTERDPQELLQTLFVEVLKALPRRLRGDPTAAELSVARKLLRDQGQHLNPIDEVDRKRFAAIRKLYLQRLREALEGDPSAAVLREVLAFLTSADMVKGIGSRMDARKALEQLTRADLPFE